MQVYKVIKEILYYQGMNPIRWTSKRIALPSVVTYSMSGYFYFSVNILLIKR